MADKATPVLQVRALMAILFVLGLSPAGCESPGEGSNPLVQEDVLEPTGGDTGLEPEPVIDCAEGPALPLARLKVKETSFVDGEGRVFLLRGVNGGGRSKLPPFLPFDFLESSAEIPPDTAAFSDALEAYSNRIVDWGHNFIRLPFTWEAVEPVRDAFDEEWLDRYEALVNSLTEKGIYVLIDFHQDVYSRVFCGDGFPLWTLAAPDTPIPPMEECQDWFLGYILPGPSRDAFDRFWANEDDLHGEFLEMWSHMIARFKDNPGVVGFELMNEPGAGNADEAEFFSGPLSDFYAWAMESLWSEHPDVIFFFDSSGLEGVSLKTSLRRPPGDQIVFAPHYYDASALIPGGTLDPKDSYHEEFGKWAEKGQEWNIPVLVGEFGARRELPTAQEYMEKNYNALDSNLLHGTGWEYSSSVLDWNFEGLSMYSPGEGEFGTALSTIRIFPSAVAGTIVSFEYKVVEGEATLVYEADGTGVTEVAIPHRLAPNGVSVDLGSATGCSRYDLPSQRLLLVVDSPGTVTATISVNP